MSRYDFILTERLAQAAFFARTEPREVIYNLAAYRLLFDHRLLNLAPNIRHKAQVYFGPPLNIAWHRFADHGLSSQVCCLNFLFPLASNPTLLAKVIGNALSLSELKMLPVEEGPSGEPYYVGFEWIGNQDYLKEWPIVGRATRGANVTSADAIVRFEHQGQIRVLLIEWKYTEAYGQPLDPTGNSKRIKRYSDKLFWPNGPITADIGLEVEDFFWEPFYQMARQQMLAWQMERAGENSAEHVSVLHISPANNIVLHKVTAPALSRFGNDAFAVFRSILVKPENFISRSTEQVFNAILTAKHVDPAAIAWSTYLLDRYRFLSSVSGANTQEVR